MSGAGAAATGVTSFSGSSDQVSGEGATYCGLPLPPGSPPDSAIHDHLCYTSGAFKLYIGDIQSAMDPAALQQRGVTHIINCCTASCGKSPAEWAPFPHLFRYGFVFSSDSFWAWGETLTPAEQALIDAQNPSSQWHAVLLLLEECRAAGGSALVHCHWCVGGRLAPNSRCGQRARGSPGLGEWDARPL